MVPGFGCINQNDFTKTGVRTSSARTSRKIVFFRNLIGYTNLDSIIISYCTKIMQRLRQATTTLVVFQRRLHTTVLLRSTYCIHTVHHVHCTNCICIR
jgi:hypothetical protein